MHANAGGARRFVSAAAEGAAFRFDTRTQGAIIRGMLEMEAGQGAATSSQCLLGFCARFIHIPCTTEIHMCAAQLSADGAEGEAASPGGGLGATSDSAAFLREAASNAAAEVCLYQDRRCFTSHTHTT